VQVSIAAQDFTVIDTASNAQIQLPVEQRAQIDLPFKASVSSSWNVLTDNLGRFFSVKRFDPKSYRSNRSSSTRSVRIPSHESSLDKKLEAEGLQEHVQFSVQQATETSSRSNAGLLSDLIPQFNQGMPRSQGYGPFIIVILTPDLFLSTTVKMYIEETRLALKSLTSYLNGFAKLR
jgi:hypothetical protein